MGIRHRRYWVRIDKHQAKRLFLKDSYWKVVKGLCGCGVSFESFNYPKHYIRHRRYWARIDKFQNKALFKKDACFIAHRGLADRREYSFESYNYRDTSCAIAIPGCASIARADQHCSRKMQHLCLRSCTWTI